MMIMKTSHFTRLLLISATLLMAACSPRFFVQISDPQLGFISKNKNFKKEKKLMDAIIPEVNRLKPDMIVFSGDLVHDRNNQEQIDGFEHMCSRFSSDIPLFYIPGNHDIGNEATNEEVQKFIKRYGSDRFVYKGKGYTVIGFNSCVIKAETEYEEAEYAWLEEQLKKAGRSKPVILVAHHPFFTKDPEEKEIYYNIKPELRMKYLNMFKEYGVDLVLAGHLHKLADGEFEGIPFYTSGAAGKAFKDGSGISLIEIRKGKPSVKYITIDSFPIEIK